MQERVWAKVIAVVGLASIVGLTWALASPHVHQEQPMLEIPLYEGAQVEWEVRLAMQEMPKQITEWAQALSVLKLAGYRIEGERAPEVLSFYEEALKDWRWILWHQRSEQGGVRLFTQDGNYLFIGVSKRYEATELVLITAQASETALDIPIFEGAELQWELVLTKQDLLEYLKQWFLDMMRNSPFPTSLSWRPHGDEFLLWLGWLGGDLIFRLLEDLSELRVIGYKLTGNKALDAMSFYEQQLHDWRRNLWIKPEESGSIRVFTRSDAQGLQELMAVATMSLGFGEEASTTVIVLRARR